MTSLQGFILSRHGASFHKELRSDDCINPAYNFGPVCLIGCATDPVMHLRPGAGYVTSLGWKQASRFMKLCKVTGGCNLFGQ